jgi:hypothetical protein
VITVEELRPVEDSAWCDAKPDDAYGVSVREEERSTRRVQDGESCEVERVDQGDGTFREERVCSPVYRNEPVYDDRCYFTVDRWEQSRTVNAAGMNLSTAPVWPETNITRSGTCMGCEREGEREEDYTLVLRAGENEYRCEVSLEQWQSAAVESSWKLNISVVTGEPDCGSLEPAA